MFEYMDVRMAETQLSHNDDMSFCTLSPNAMPTLYLHYTPMFPVFEVGNYSHEQVKSTEQHLWTWKNKMAYFFSVGTAHG